MTRFVVVIDDSEEFYTDDGEPSTAKGALVSALDFAEISSMVYEQAPARAQLERNAEALLTAARAVLKLSAVAHSEQGRALADAIALCCDDAGADSGAAHAAGNARATT